MAESEKYVDISTKTATSHFVRLDPQTVYLKRLQHRNGAQTEVDTFGRFWAISYGRALPGQLRVRHGDKMIDLVGEGSVFIPPFSMVEWHLSDEPLEFEAILCSKELPDFFPKVPIQFRPPFPGLPRSVAGVVEYVREAKDIRLVGIDDGTHPLAQRTKGVIDRTYATDMTMAEIADSLGTSPSVMARNFRVAYGFSPIWYRNKLRIAESWCLLLTSGAPVTEVSHIVGFQDLSRYNKQFRRHVRTTPSEYRS